MSVRLGGGVRRGGLSPPSGQPVVRVLDGQPRVLKKRETEVL